MGCDRWLKVLGLESIATDVQQTMLSDNGAHDWLHIKRTCALAHDLQIQEGGDPRLVALACLLHDISDHKLNGGDATVAKDVAERILRANEISPSEQESVISFLLVSGHSKRSLSNRWNWPIEWKIAQDADYLEAIGAVGLARAFWFSGYKRESICSMSSVQEIDQIPDGPSALAHVATKLLVVRECMLTRSGRILADHRHHEMLQYLSWFARDWNVGE